MSRFSRFCLAVLLVLAVSLGGLGVVQAARGAPGSLEFGIGTAFYPGGTYPDQALQMAEDLAPDWVYVPVSWAAYQADPAAAPRFEALDAVFQMAERNQIAVAASIVDAPGWAQTGQGPQAGETAKFVTALSQRYPRTLQAVELFPRANTQAAWGGPADPLAYFDLFRQVDAGLRASGSTLTLVAAGLQPLAAHPAAGDMDDLLFLRGLYAAGARDLMPVISLQYVELTGDPLSFPDGGDARVLRHYEDVRKIMVENNHRFGVIWITLICSPSSKIEASGVTIEDDELQVNWMTQIYIQARSQLYLGVIIGQSLNSEREGTAAEGSSMLQGAGLVHPFYAVLKEMISLNKAGSFTIKPGRPKEGNFLKHRP
jgi:hypothetical protein